MTNNQTRQQPNQIRSGNGLPAHIRHHAHILQSKALGLFPQGIIPVLMMVLIGITTNLKVSAQSTQTIRGRIVDKETQAPLIGATVTIAGTQPLKGAISDADGNYRITQVPVGRYTIQISYTGYKPVIMPEVMVTSGKEVVMTTGMVESVSEMKEVLVSASQLKSKPINSMALVSARSFTVEETRRYAGGLDDPGRLVSAFAGVSANNLSDNSICIRGNSPKGVSWRLEGVEIPTPSHFNGANVAGGGLVTLFSSQLLANSDFFTGAFPAEYGNALAGVFDMKLRNGNNEHREHAVQFGMMGIDLSSEGPFAKGHSATYLFNYRYSTFGLITKLGLVPSAELPDYQDLSFKFQIPTKKAGTFSFWGIGGLDHSIKTGLSDSTKWDADWDRVTYNWNIKTGATGISHRITLGKLFLQSTLAASGIQNTMDATRLDSHMVQRPNWHFIDESGKLTLTSVANYKVNARTAIRAGMNLHQLFYHLDLNSTLNDVPETYQNTVREQNTSNVAEVYTQVRYDLSDRLMVTGGLMGMYFALNGTASADPRASLRYTLTPRHAISLGYGKHTQLEELKIYLYRAPGSSTYPNQFLTPSHAHHFVLSYDWSLSEHLRLKVEPYFQYLYGVPGMANSAYSLINFKQDWSFRNTLANNSYGKNTGIEFTFERFLHNNVYYLITTSLFDSRYKGDDGIWRPTRYAKGIVINALAGREFILASGNIISINGRLTYSGGERYSPVITGESIKRQYVVYDDTRAFEAQGPSTTNLDVSVSYRVNKPRYSGIWSLQVKNISGSPMFSGFYYNYRSNSISRDDLVVVLPNLSYKIEF